MLKGTTESSRGAGIADLAPYLKTDLTAQQAATILGRGDLEGWDRARAIGVNRTGQEAGSAGCGRGADAQGYKREQPRSRDRELGAPTLKRSSRGAGSRDTRGIAEELAGWDRARAIQSIARSGKVRAGLSEAELAPVLDGTTWSARAFALAELRAAKSSLAGTTAGSTPDAPASSVNRESDISRPMVAPPCTAPNVAAHLYISNPDCRQLWSYHLYRLLAVSTFSAQGDLISLAEKRALKKSL